MKKEEIRVEVAAEKKAFLYNEGVKGTLRLTSGEVLVLQGIEVHLAGFFSTFELSEGALLETKTVFFESSPSVVLIPEGLRTITIPSGTLLIPFSCPPLIELPSVSAFLPNQVLVRWFIVISVKLDGVRDPMQSLEEITLQSGYQAPVIRSPPTNVLEKRFLTQSPIHFRCFVHKSSLTAGENLLLTVSINNQSLIPITSLLCELKQLWVCKDQTLEVKNMLLEVDAASLLPLPGQTK